MRRRPEEPEPEGFNLTPMIDVTFQLLMFFLLTTNLTQAETALVRLPAASRTEEIEFSDPPLILTILRDGRVRAGGRTLFDPRREEEPTRLETVLRARPSGAFGVPVVIRADCSTEFQHLQQVLMLAPDSGRVTQLCFDVRKE